jgi:hypothetical protein
MNVTVSLAGAAALRERGGTARGRRDLPWLLL